MNIPDKISIDDDGSAPGGVTELMIEVGGKRVMITVAEGFDLLAHLSLMLRGAYANNRH